MRKYFIWIISSLFLFIFATSSLATSNVKKQWTYKPAESYFQERWLYHVTKEGTAIYMMGDGEGNSKMVALSQKGKRLWDKKLETSFSIGAGIIPALYLVENGQISKYNLNTGKKLSTINVPKLPADGFELFGVSKNNTFYLIEYSTLKIIEIDDHENILSSYENTLENTKNIKLQTPNIQYGDRNPPEKIIKALDSKKILPSFIKNKKSFEHKYGKEAKYFPFYTSITKGTTVYVLAYYQINGKKIYSHSVLYKFSSSGKYLSQKDLGDYNGKDIAVDSKGNAFVTLNKLSKSNPYAFIKIVSNKNKIVKEIKFSGRFIFGGKICKDQLFVVSDKYFYMYR